VPGWGACAAQQIAVSVIAAIHVAALFRATIRTSALSKRRS
jgi:hypothetical protein